MPEPTKAYYVERVSRCVVTLLIYANNAEDAKRRATMDGESVSCEYEPRGYGSVRRERAEDR